jgi:hypothetical protein
MLSSFVRLAIKAGECQHAALQIIETAAAGKGF